MSRLHTYLYGTLQVAHLGDNNCKGEFDYAKTRKGSKMLLPVVMESALLSQRLWKGHVGLALNQRMFANCSVEGREDIDGIMRELAAMGVQPTHESMA